MQKIETEKLNRNQIKYIAIVAMVIDHVAYRIIGHMTYDWTPYLYTLMRFIGRLTGPIMFIFLAEGFRHTSDKKKYGVRLLIFALISQIPFTLVRSGQVFDWHLSVISTLFMSFLMLLAYEKINNSGAKWFVIFAIICSTFIMDWGITGPVITLIFYLYPEQKNQELYYAVLVMAQTLLSLMINVMNGYPWYSEIWQLGMLLIIPIFRLYDGTSGRKSRFNKWFFYVFYPLHLLVIYFVWMGLKTHSLC